MKFTISTSTLNQALSSVGAAIRSADPIAIITCVRIEAADGLEFRGTNLAFEITKRVAAEVIRPGSLCVSHEKLLSWVATLPKDATVEIDAKDNALVCRSGRSSKRLPTLDTDGFPAFEEIKGAAMMQFDAAVLMRALSIGLPCAAGEKDAKYWQGIHCAVSGDGLRFEGCNGQIGVRTIIELPSGARDMPGEGIIISPHTIKAARSVVPQEGIVTVKASDRLLVIEAEDGRLISRLVDDKYPNLDMAIPRDTPLSVSFDREAVCATLTRVLSGRSQEAKSCRTVLDFAPDRFAISVGSPGDLEGDAEDSVECFLGSDAFRLATHGRKFLTVLDALDAETIELQVGAGGQGNFILTPAPPNGTSGFCGGMKG